MSSSPPSNAVDITSIPAPQLSQLQQRLSSELEHLTTSHTKLRSAQIRFRECIKSIETGVIEAKADQEILVPLTGSLYVPGKLADREKVIVDVGTGFYVEKTTQDAIKFYRKKVEDLSKNLNDLEKIIQGKSDNLRVVEDVLRQKVLAGQTAPQAAA
ncbi:putative prefoldin subunit [Phaeomoniella chlamydospora]|uniref:Putative prefoldin subunit n=1 Tax=Phaeomoniella chlamydospora TaxID=158046 RepID=A0A0G2GK51_PHACM|nr:putative prefoldin subunit [Phaeomoniella chlamydospora]